jgi:hypothetical protein
VSVDAQDFAITWAVVLDGLSIQVALQDTIVTPDRAFDIAMTLAEQALSLPPARRRAKKTARGSSNGKATRR